MTLCSYNKHKYPLDYDALPSPSYQLLLQLLKEVVHYQNERINIDVKQSFIKTNVLTVINEIVLCPKLLNNNKVVNKTISYTQLNRSTKSLLSPEKKDSLVLTGAKFAEPGTVVLGPGSVRCAHVGFVLSTVVQLVLAWVHNRSCKISFQEHQQMIIVVINKYNNNNKIIIVFIFFFLLIIIIWCQRGTSNSLACRRLWGRVHPLSLRHFISTEPLEVSYEF